jgi:hypothetical protein
MFSSNEKRIRSKESVSEEKWCSCIDGVLTRENYFDSIKKAGFEKIEILSE